MRRGIAQVRFPADAAVSAPSSGIALGVTQSGPATLRLFRLTGTTVVVVSSIASAQLMAVRVMAAGTPVQILTGRPDVWQQVRFSERLGHVYGPQDQVRAPDGPSLLIDDRPPAARRPVEGAPWQCRVDVRSEWTLRDIGGFAFADLTVFGALPPDATGAVATAYRVPQDLASGLARSEPGVVGVARRGALQYVQLNPSPAEAALLAPVQGVPNQPIWR